MSSFSQPHFKATSYTGAADGPRVIFLGAVHGNETCGTRAIERVLTQLDAGSLHIRAGSATFVAVTNALAYARGQRMGQRDLNRNLFPTDAPHDIEDHVANWLCPLLARHDVLLDLHSFNAHGAPFASVGPRDNEDPLEPFSRASEERALAKRLGVHRFIDGWLPTYARGVARRLPAQTAPLQREQALRYGVGSTEYMRSVGGYALTLECGQHNDPAAPEVAYRAIRNTLAHLGLSGDAAPSEVTQYEALRLTDVVDRGDAGDVFEREWRSFDAVRCGDVIGTSAGGTPILAPYDGCIVFPDSQAAPGKEWFYVAQINADF